jgi:hypothetical protein
MTERTTTLQLYWGDLLWLQARQREISFKEGKTLTMPELMRDFVRAIQEWEATGEGAEA